MKISNFPAVEHPGGQFVRLQKIARHTSASLTSDATRVQRYVIYGIQASFGRHFSAISEARWTANTGSDGNALGYLPDSCRDDSTLVNVPVA